MSLVSWIAIIIVALLLAGAIFVLVKDKKEGKSSCGGYCAGCMGCSAYNDAQKKKKEHDA